MAASINRAERMKIKCSELNYQMRESERVRSQFTKTELKANSINLNNGYCNAKTKTAWFSPNIAAEGNNCFGTEVITVSTDLTIGSLITNSIANHSFTHIGSFADTDLDRIGVSGNS